jgi:hypothetical protein
MEESMAKKIRLNDDQWTKLVTLASLPGTEANVEPSHFSGRLSSHGLVARSQTGHARLTEQGKHRLNQGR